MKTTIATSIDVSLAVRLDEFVTRRTLTKSAVIAAAIEHFLTHCPDAKVAEIKGGNRSNRDGLDAVALEIIRATPGTLRVLQRALAAKDIRRSLGWIADRRNPQQGPTWTNS